MIDLDGIIRHRQLVKLTKQQVAVVDKLYSKNVIDNTIVESIKYLSEGLNINGYIARPKKEGQYPVLIWNRGGSGDKGALDDLNAYLILASTAVWGYVVLGTQYRGNMGSEGNEEWGAGDLTDSLNLIKVAENIPECDLDRIAIEGPSRGGMVTYRALKEYRRFKCAIVHAGITDVFRLPETRPGFKEFVNRQFGDMNERQRTEAIINISAVYFADRLPRDVPVLIMHGDKDNVIPIEQSQSLIAELKKHNISHKFAVIENGTHVALKDGTYKEIDRLRKEWLEKYLK